MTNDVGCPICSLDSSAGVTAERSGDRITYECPRCGPFVITGTAQAVASNRTIDPRLPAWIRERAEYGSPPPEIAETSLDNLSQNLPDHTPTQKQLLLLRSIERHTEYPGHRVSLIPRFDYPLAWATREEEFVYYVNALEARGFLRATGEGDDPKRGLTVRVEIKPEGWEYLDKQAEQPAFMDQAFVAMCFSSSLLEAWEKGIKPAVTEAGYKPYRVDTEPHAERIDAKIITEILNSRFLVADVTEQKRGVYFEAGFALGLKRPVLWSVRNDDLKNVHFDTRQYNHVLWDTPEDLREKLYYLICSVIGKR
jgi:nucleoside 2-deoxyribosyltransferase